MFPQEARLRTTYSSSMNVDMNIQYVIRNGENLDNCETIYKTLPNIHIESTYTVEIISMCPTAI